MRSQYCAVSANYIRMGREMNGVLYAPKTGRKKAGVVVIHSDADYLNSPCGEQLAKRGFLTLCANVEHPGAPLETRLPDVKRAIGTLRAQAGVEYVVLLGHSGGATLMTCYQAVAENGAAIFQDEGRIVRMGPVEALPSADGLMLIDSNFGNGVMTLVSLDPDVTDESTGVKTSRAHDAFSEESGYDGDGGAAYTEEFRRGFYAAQAARQARLMGHALERLKALERHEGAYSDDEPLIVPGGSQIAPNNRLFPQDLHMLAHTRKEYDLIHADGSITRQVVPSVRTARKGMDPTPLFGLGAMSTTVRTYLTSNCVRTRPDYAVTEDGIEGIDYDSAFCCPPGNVKHIHVPLLVMGMTGGYECIASEIIYQNAASADKTIAFVEGGTHMLGTARDAEAYPGQFGDAARTLFDHISDWLDARYSN